MLGPPRCRRTRTVRSGAESSARNPISASDDFSGTCAPWPAPIPQVLACPLLRVFRHFVVEWGSCPQVPRKHRSASATQIRGPVLFQASLMRGCSALPGRFAKHKAPKTGFWPPQASSHPRGQRGCPLARELPIPRASCGNGAKRKLFISRVICHSLRAIAPEWRRPDPRPAFPHRSRTPVAFRKD